MKVAAWVAIVGVIASILHGCGNTQDSSTYTYEYKVWSDPIKAGTCSPSSTPLQIKISSKTGADDRTIECSFAAGAKTYKFPAGIFEIGEQMLVPEFTSITGAMNPNDNSEPTKSPDWQGQTLFLATRGVTDYKMNYCHAANMVTTRVGFVLSSYVTVRDVSYQGIDTIRPSDNGALCGGGIFETRGCAENDCTKSVVNNGGSDGIGSSHVTIENVRLNDYFYEEDKAKIGAPIAGNTNCTTEDWDHQCCFCKPNGVRSSQVGVWVPQSRNAEGTSHLVINNVVSSSNQADGINLHGYVHEALVQNAYFQNTGDDIYVVWGARSNPTNVTFKDSVAVRAGILRPNWYGNCVATYGLKSVVFDHITCRAPTPLHPIPSPHDGSTLYDTSMFVFYQSFDSYYPPDNRITLIGWTFESLQGQTYTPQMGSMGKSVVGKMVWTKPEDTLNVSAPYYIPTNVPKVNVYIVQNSSVVSRRLTV